MTRRARLALVALFVAGAAAAIFGARVLQALDLPRINLEHTGLVRLDPRTERLLATLDDDVLATFCVSARDELPSSERRLERDVTRLLERLKRAARGRFDYQIVDPTAHPDLAEWFARQGVAPFTLREVRADAFEERSVHASLMLSYGVHGKHVLRGLSSRHLVDLELLIDQHLAELAHPSRPKVALSTSSDAGELAALLGDHADVARVDFDGGAELPEPCELFIWLDPVRADEAQLARLDRFLAHGSNVVIAGSPWHPTVDAAAKTLRFVPRSPAFAKVCAEFGVKVASDVVLDASPREVLSSGATETAASVRSIAPDQDFRWIGSQPNGSLEFLAPSALEFDPAKLVDRALVPHVLAASRATCFRRAPSPTGDSVALAELAPHRGELFSRETLAALLAPKDPWSGSLAVFASSSAFRDGIFERPEFAHANLARALFEGFASSERSALVRARKEVLEPLPPLTARSRLGWRLFVIFLVPVLLFVTAVARGSLSPGWFARLGASRELAFAVVLIAALGASGWLISALPQSVRLDATVDRRHELAPATRAIAAKLANRAIAAELVTSSSLPPIQSAAVERARVLCTEIARSIHGWSLRRAVFEDASDERRAQFARDKIAARPVENFDESAQTLRSVVAALRLSDPERPQLPSETIDLASNDAEATLEFRIVCALERLDGAHRPRVAVAADAPRLSPAEVRQLYEARHLFAPTENDVYGAAEDLLSDSGFDVTRIDPAHPVLEADIDLLLWLEPRRNIEPMLAALVEHLRRGKNAIVAGQHFTIQSRRLDRDALELAHWPRPQYCDQDRGWFDAIGAPLVREVLCDASSAAMEVASEVERDGAARDLELASSTQPFQIRALPENFAANSPITAGLSDQLFAYGNRFALDAAKLTAHGLRATTLIATSPRAWSIDWKGGNLKPADLAVPSAPPLANAPLAVLLEGSFPTLEGASDPAPSARLLLVGSSELFKSTRLFDPDFRGADLLLSAAAALGLSDDHARVLARRATRRGFEAPKLDARLSWRAFAIGVGPLFTLLFAFLVRRLGARALPGVAP